jgi:sulfate transport system ATP-binding protein
VAYVRTYEVDVAPTADGGPAIAAVVRHVRALGPRVRLELDPEGADRPIEADVTRQRFDELQVRKGDRVYVSARRARVFRLPPRP